MDGDYEETRWHIQNEEMINQSWEEISRKSREKVYMKWSEQGAINKNNNKKSVL